MGYSEIRKTSRAQHAKAYANGGRVKSAKTVINIVTPPAASGGAAQPPIAGMAAGPAAGPLPPVPPASGGIPPVAANAALGAMGGAPAFANGGGVKRAPKVVGGAASGPGRLRHNRNPKSKV